MSSNKKRESSRIPFPLKLHRMVEDAHKKNFSNIVSWNSKGTGFIVHDKELFTRRVAPHYFNQTKYKSFQRQLCLYGFGRVTSGKEKGCRFHQLFRRGDRTLCERIGYSDQSPSTTHNQPPNTSATTLVPTRKRSPPHYIHHDVGLRPRSSNEQQRTEADNSERRSKKICIEQDKPEKRRSSPDWVWTRLPCRSPLARQSPSSSNTTTTGVGVFEGVTFHLSSTLPIDGFDAVVEGGHNGEQKRCSARLVSEHSDDAAHPYWTAASSCPDDVDEALRKAWELGYSFALSLPATELVSTMTSDNRSNMMVELNSRNAKI